MDRFRSPTSRMMMMRTVSYMIISQKTGIIITSLVTYRLVRRSVYQPRFESDSKHLYDSKHWTKI